MSRHTDSETERVEFIANHLAKNFLVFQTKDLQALKLDLEVLLADSQLLVTGLSSIVKGLHSLEVCSQDMLLPRVKKEMI